MAVPRARLLLFRDTLGELAQHRLAEQFARHGITRDRLEMRQARVHGCDHLIQYHAIDITLYSFPWNGHATACESLWMGVPVLTLVGDRHSGRMVASALTALGMNDWVAAQPRDYVDRAVCMAKNLEGLSVLRQNLRDKMESSLICDGATFTLALESTYRQMWQTWCAQITNQSA